MRTAKILLATTLTLFAALFAVQAAAQGLTVQIVNGVPSAIPITVVPFGQQGSGPASPVDIAQVVGMDLNRCGKFRTLPTGEIVESPTTGSQIKFATWQQLKQDYIVVGR
ncbi:MAG TPA: Tol-Pal system protein TolB, partial [Rhodanobacteraceae bacterium]|nr:Tol-Pal system protein TolB [Rhodanobacteraceae bacterium]